MVHRLLLRTSGRFASKRDVSAGYVQDGLSGHMTDFIIESSSPWRRELGSGSSYIGLKGSGLPLMSFNFTSSLDHVYILIVDVNVFYVLMYLLS